MDEPYGSSETLLPAPVCSSMQELDFDENFNMRTALHGAAAGQGESHDNFMGQSISAV